MAEGSLFKPICLVLLGVIVALLPCELALRLFYPAQYPTYSSLEKHKRYTVNGRESKGSGMFTRSNYYAFESRHNLHAVITDRNYSFTQKVTTNGDGFRFTGNLNNQNKIMVLGDSVTFGVGVDDGESYPDQLQRLLGQDYQVLNYGVGAWGFAEYYLTYKRYAPRIRPRLIILGVFPANDFADLMDASWPGKAQGDLPRPPLTRKDVFVDQEGFLRSTDWTYRVPGLRELATFVLINKVLGRRLSVWADRLADHLNALPTEELSLKIITEMARNQHLLVLLLPARQTYGDKKFLRKVENYREKVAQIKGVHLLDFFPVVQPRAGELYVDANHFNPAGNRLVAQEIYGFLMKNRLLSRNTDSPMAAGKQRPLL
jgi:lysophospholipase L1-like esterase